VAPRPAFLGRRGPYQRIGTGAPVAPPGTQKFVLSTSLGLASLTLRR